MSEKYERQYQRNRCKRCDRPLSNPTDDYGWRCAQIIGIENYNSTLSNLDSDSLVLYNMYVDRYLTDESNERMIPPNISTDGITNKVAFLSPTGWKYVVGSREKAIAHRLTVESENVNYVAAYLAYWQDRWKYEYPEIDGRTAVLATLFNQGEIQSPHANPKPNSFGVQAKKEYQYMRQLLGLE